MGGKFPDIPASYIFAGLKWLAAQAVAWGVLNGEPRQIVLSAGSTILAGVYVLGDVYLRGRRNDNRGKPVP